ncbi:MAG: amidohydrolase family protein [Planctomycetaceae bacterium]
MTASQDRSFVVRAKWLLPGGAFVLDGGWVDVRRGRIVAVGKGRPSKPALDFGDSIVVPGLVNPHTHLEFSLLERPFEQGPGGLVDWIRGLVSWRRDSHDSRRTDPGAAMRAGLLESIASGVTAIGEIATDPLDTPLPSWSPRLRIYHEGIGLRPTRIAGERIGCLERRLTQRIDANMRAGESAGVSPHAPYSVRAEVARTIVALARRRGLPAMVHLAESAEEGEFLAHRRGPWRSLLEDLDAWPDVDPPLLPAVEWITLLSGLRRAAVVHGTFLDEESRCRLARHADRIALVVCPRTACRISGRLQGGVREPPVSFRRLSELRRAGVRVAIGTDGKGSSPDLSVRAEAAAAVEYGFASPREAFDMITRSAAWAIGLDHIAGEIRVGRPADLAIFAPAVGRDPFAGLFDPSSFPLATYRSGRPIWRRETIDGEG